MVEQLKELRRKNEEAISCLKDGRYSNGSYSGWNVSSTLGDLREMREMIEKLYEQAVRQESTINVLQLFM